MNRIPFQCLESSERIGNDITREIWFITTAEGKPVRRTLYKTEDGSVVAIKDSGNGVNTALFVETMFYELNKTETAWFRIKADSGVYSDVHIPLFQLFDMG